MENHIERGREAKHLFNRDLLINILIIIAIVSLGIFAVNQIYHYLFNTQFLFTPCELCVKANPQFKPCMETTLRTTGNWYDINMSLLNTSEPPIYNLT